MRGLLLVALSLLAGCGPPTLAEVQREVFSPRCSNAACHGGAQPAARLDLSEGRSYGATVEAEAVNEPGSLLVVPGRPEESLLYLVTGGPVGRVRQMPVGFELEPSERELLRRWIEAGALP